MKFRSGIVLAMGMVRNTVLGPYPSSRDFGEDGSRNPGSNNTHLICSKGIFHSTVVSVQSADSAKFEQLLSIFEKIYIYKIPE